MLSTAGKNNKVFKNYPLCPPELRMMVVNEMSSDDRCRFQRCARMCQAEAKSSINFIHTLEFHVRTPANITVDVRNGDPSIYGPTGYTMEFTIEQQHIYMIHKTCDSQQLWWKLLDSSNIHVIDKLKGFAFHFFKDLLARHQRGIQKLLINWDLPDLNFSPSPGVLILTSSKESNSDVDFGIRDMSSLKQLEMSGNVDYRQFISKAKPLDQLTIYKNKNYEKTLDQAQLFEVQNKLIYPELQLNYEQFIQLKATNIHIHIGQLTVTDVLNFILSWQNDTIRKNVTQVTWELKDANFDSLQLLNRLRERRQRRQQAARSVWIVHHIDVFKRAELDISSSLLKINFSFFGFERDY